MSVLTLPRLSSWPDLPSGWRMAEFGDVAKVQSDRGRRVPKRSYQPEGHLAVVDQGEQLVGGFTDDVSLAAPSPCVVFGDHTRRVKVVGFPFAVGAQGVKLLAPTDQVSLRFLGYLVATAPLPDKGYARHFQYLRSLTFPLPPEHVQDAIVEEVEKQFTRLDAGVAALGAARSRLRRHRTAVLGLAVGGANSRARDGRLSDFAEVQLGRQRSPKNHSGPNMKPYLRAANVTWSGLDLSDVKEMNFSRMEAERFALQTGDLLVAEASGSQFEVGKSAMWTGEIEECCFQNTLLRVRCFDVLPEFLLLVFQHAAASGAFGRAARGVGIHHLGAKALSEWPVKVPDVSAQERIVEATQAALSTLVKVETQVRAAERRAAGLGQMILRKAFEGELVSPDQEEVA